jgi:lysophospholipase L1-like esterase
MGCSGAPAPDDPASETGGSPPLTASGGTSMGTAGSGSAGMGGAPPSNSAGSGSSTAGAAAGGAGSAGTSSAGGAPMSGGDAPSAGSGGAGMGGAAAGGGAGGSPVDPALLPDVTLHLAGDSTVMTYEASSAQEGWGQELPQFLLTKVKLDNQAIGGASVETFYTGRWKNIMSNLRAGDYVMAAFGANDSGNVDGRHVEPPAFQARFATMAQEVMAKQATFIIVTPSALQEWSGGKNTNNRLGPYVTVLHTLSETKGLKLADLNARSLELLNQIGQEAAKEIYINGDKAHFTKKGATQMAELVAHELTRIASPLGRYVK